MIRNIVSFIRNRNIEIASLIGAIVLWQFIADVIVQRKLFLPSFTDVVSSF